MTRRALFARGATAGALLCAASSAGSSAGSSAAPSTKMSAPRLRLRVTHHVHTWPGLRRRVRLAHLTDVHVGWTTPRAHLERVLEVTREARPELVAMTGDYVNHTLVHLDEARWFAEQLPKPAVAVLGNHDHWADARAITRCLEAAGVSVLSNESLEWSGPHGVLPIVGVDDFVTGHADLERAFCRVSDPKMALVLEHAPSAAPLISARAPHLILAGHTHGGSVSVPSVTQPVARALGQPYLFGWHTIEGTQLYVNAGIGHARSGLRIGRSAAPEVAIVDLVSG